MKRKSIFHILLLITFVLTSEALLARGGGGGGHGGGGFGGGRFYGGGHHGSGGPMGIWEYIVLIGFIVFGSFTGLVSILLLWKTNYSKRLIRIITTKDSFWNINNMRLNARKTFYSIQDAWEDRDICKVKTLITPQLYDKYNAMLAKMKENFEKNIIKNIDIKEIKILGCEDYKDDSKDRYIAYIKGNILDYTVDVRTGNIIKNPERTTEEFVDTYHFVRVKNKWILENIDNSVSSFDILRARNFREI